MTYNAVSNSMLQTAPPDGLRGRVMSLRAFVFAGMSPIGAFQIGAVATGLGHAAASRLGPAAEQYGPRGAVAIGAVVCLLAALLVIVLVPQLRRTER
jgi:membrane protein DedA with SNARE-associated domain